MLRFPTELEVRIDTARGDFVKRRDDGSVEFVSPLPSPFNYGSVAGTLAPDGDREDVIVLGARLRAGTTLRARVLGRARFVDAGVADPKWLCGERLTTRDVYLLQLFFWAYTRFKRVLHAVRGERGPTHFDGIELAS